MGPGGWCWEIQGTGRYQGDSTARVAQWKVEWVTFLKDVSEDFIIARKGVMEVRRDGRTLKPYLAIPHFLPQVFEIMSDKPPSDYLLLAILAYFLSCPFGSAALYYSSQVGICIVQTAILPSLFILA